MTTKEAIDGLDELMPGDNEATHSIADKIVLAWLDKNGGEEIATAYRLADERCLGFWCA